MQNLSTLERFCISFLRSRLAILECLELGAELIKLGEGGTERENESNFLFFQRMVSVRALAVGDLSLTGCREYYVRSQT